MKDIDFQNPVGADGYSFADPPLNWNASTGASLSSLHQLSPYIGKLKPQIARDLILTYTSPGDLIVDPFCGSGGIPLEAHLNHRRVIASDISPYAFVLTEAKLQPPRSYEHAIGELEQVYRESQQRPDSDLNSMPDWVKQFFNPKTLAETIKFADECLIQRKAFLLACLLGILHHQRPGFLSYPSSHLVPYLRDKKFPKCDYPEMYGYRELLPRMAAKIARAYKTNPLVDSRCSTQVLYSDIKDLRLPSSRVDAIITSPPYMNALDYRRDNRLRLWFLDRATQNYAPEPTDKKAGLELMVSQLVHQAVRSLRKGGKLVLVIGEMVVRKRLSSHPSSAYARALQATGKFELIDAIRDQIPDVRRSRREYSGTKAEHFLVYEKIK
jgi:hypothetical protein